MAVDSVRLDASEQAHALSNQERRSLLEAAEESGSLSRGAVAEILDQRPLNPLELDAVSRELEQHGIELVEDERVADRS
jgi:hypothetical protein